MNKRLSKTEEQELLDTLKARFQKNVDRHKALEWPEVQQKLEANPEKLWSLHRMEETGGEPDVAGYDAKTDECIFIDCSKESPKGRRSVCYDDEALASRKKYKPENSCLGMAEEMGISLLTEAEYFELQQHEQFDNKTSSWLATPPEIREKGGAIFGDRRFGRVFIYHNGAESYYGARGFRGLLRV